MPPMTSEAAPDRLAPEAAEVPAAGEAASGGSAARHRFAHLPADLRDPKTTVVITSYNYGHFLRDCIESALAQTWPADQVIVVDDGSQDGSAAVLADHAGRIEVLDGRGRGQAAAFNLGFRHATGDLVFFLDADDLLRPEAIEVVLAHHAPDMAMLAFGLETIDASGQSTGAHPFSLDADEGDNRPRLLRPGSLGAGFSFAPTSGNVFSRWFLARALPMPEPEWRICADAYLVRAAALLGRIGALRRVLGAYRVHGGNNYIRADTFDPWSMRRGLRDLKISADALVSAADCPRLLRDEEGGELVRLALRRRAVETLALMAAWSGDGRDLDLAVRRVRSATLRARLPPRERLAGAALFGGAETWPDRLTRILGVEALKTRLARLERPRWLTTLPYGRAIAFAERGPHRNILAEGWSGELHEGRCRSAGASAMLEFLLDPAEVPVAVEIGVGVPEPWRATGLRFTAEDDGNRLWAGEVRRTGTLRFSLDRHPSAPLHAVRVRVSCARLGAEPAEGWGSGQPFFTLDHVSACARKPSAAYPLVETGARLSAAEILGTDPEASGWRLAEGGAALIFEASATMRLSHPPGPEWRDLVLDLSEPVPRGWLGLRCGGSDIFTGRTGATARLVLPLPNARDRTIGRIELSFAFSPEEPGGDAGFGIRSVGIAGRTGSGDPHARLRYRAPPGPVLHPGQVVHLTGQGANAGFLEAGWSRPEAGGLRNLGAEASLRIRPQEGAMGLRLRLGLGPVLPPLSDCRHVLGLSVRGAMLQAVDLAGEAELVVELPEDAADDRGEIVVGLHSVYSSESAGDQGADGLRHAPFELTSIGLDGQGPPAQRVERAGARYPRPAFLGLLDALAAGDDGAADLGELLQRRAALVEALAVSDARGLALAFSRPDWVRGLERLGGLTAGAPLAPPERGAAAAAAAAAQGDGEARLRAFAIGMLLLSAFRLPGAVELEALPATLLRHGGTVARYIGREPELESAAEVTAYIGHLEALLASVERLLDREEPGSARYGLAVAVLQELRSTKALFGGHNLVGLIRLRSRCIEKLLSRAGALLPMPVRPRAGARRLRLGVLVRSLRPSPEAWAFLGMYREIDRSRFELILITTDRADDEIPSGGIAARTLPLAGRPVDEAVAAIRALDLDLFVLGAYVANWERVSAIVAHRLARIQISACFNCPSTLGFRSFDVALAWKGVDAAGAQAQHTERLVCTEAPLQCCFDFAGLRRPSEPAGALRRGIGVPENAVLLTSGAMAHKIVPELMRAWADILARAPAAILVLYPFAPFWAMRFSAELFRRRLDARLTAAGVAPERVRLLDEQPPEQVRRILAASDLYLDSFPYSGATTVCEAFACGVPVVARDGPMLRERTGAAWVRAYGLPDLVAATDEDYVAIAAGLATDAAARAAAAGQVARVLAQGTPPHADSARFGGAMSDALWRIAEESGHFPGLVRAEAANDPVRDGDGQPLAPGRSSSRKGLRASMAVEAETSAPPPEDDGARPGTGMGTVRVAIVTTGRSGSTLLSVVLGRCAGAEMHFELFHEIEIQYRDGEVTDPDALRARDADPAGFADRVFADAEARGASLVGFKLFVYRDRAIIRHVLTDPRVRVLCLYRSNTLAQYASQRIAEKTGEWALVEGPRELYPAIPFDAEDFRRFEAGASRFAAEITALLAEAGREALFVEYNAILEPETIRRMSDFLGIAIPAPENIAMHRQNSARAIDRFSDPEVVRRYLEAVGKAHWADTS